MPNYRLYRLDGAGKISSAEWLEAADDGDAEVRARAMGRQGVCEVWQRNRLVCRIDGRRPRRPG